MGRLAGQLASECGVTWGQVPKGMEAIQFVQFLPRSFSPHLNNFSLEINIRSCLVVHDSMDLKGGPLVDVTTDGDELLLVLCDVLITEPILTTNQVST